MKSKEKKLWVMCIGLFILFAINTTLYEIEKHKMISARELMLELIAADGAEDFESDVPDDKLENLIEYIQSYKMDRFDSLLRIEGTDKTYVVHYINMNNRELQITDVTVEEGTKEDIN
ncbi:hypothetical protein [Aureibacillus halotolerans]|nr:hypothetical protein [Aureibacillus halotolerans]